MTATVPPAKPRQRMQALKKANEVRIARSKLHQQVLRREIGFDAVLADPPDFLSTMPVFELLMWAPKIGRVKASRLLRRARLTATRQVGQLTARERSEIRKLVAG